MVTPPSRSSLFPAGTLAPATAKTLWGNFYDYVASLGGALGGYAGLNQYNAAQTLTAAADGNKLIILGGGGSAITLPLANTCPAGTQISLFTQGGDQTVSPQGGNVIAFGPNTSAASFQLNGADFVSLVSDGTNAWIGASGSPMMSRGGTTGVFGASLGGSGYQKLPGGLIIQWGSTIIATGGSVVSTRTLPITFPNAILSVYGTSLAGGGSFGSAGPINNSTISVWGNNATMGITWLAIGY